MPSKLARLEAWLRERAPTQVELADFESLLEIFAPIAESGLRHLLRESGAKLHPLVAGVDQSSPASLRDSLLALADCYERGNAETRRLTRQIVITAKDHAKLAARNRLVSEEKRRIKAEMASWMLIWLENPAVFPLWITLREKTHGANSGDIG